MAKIVEVTNPVTGQPTQVDQLDHTAQQIDDGLNIARGVSNPNLLDNWYFANPINQRGQTSYTGAGYGIDRWIQDGSITTLLTNDGLQITNSSDVAFGISQIFGTNYSGKTLTASILAEPGTPVVVWCNLNQIAAIQADSGGLATISFVAPTNDISKISLSVGKGTFLFKAAKLELGNTQTLAHQDADGNWVLNEIPDYGEQLRRCQRYFVNFNPYKFGWFSMPPAVASNASQAYSVVTLPVAMRAQPVVTYGGNIALSQEGDHVVTAILVSDFTFTGNSVQLRYDVSAGTLAANSLYRVQGLHDPISYIWLSADL